ncbi:MAG: 4Fe-4S dicluster domain-containing protein, partial [Actinomycetota bacterium]
PITASADLPIGWTEEQNGARYRLEPTGTEEVFAFSSPSTSWKRYLYPERTLLIRATRSNGEVVIHQPSAPRPELAFFGVRSCDLAALDLLDRVFLDDNATDPDYAARRSDVFIIAAGCAHPGNTCFCASMDTGPSPRAGYDLSIAELHGSAEHRFLVTIGTARGRELVARISTTPADIDDLGEAAATNDRAIARMGRQLRSADPPRAAEQPEHPRWDEIAERCLSCGNCTMVCPTCFCSATEDVTDLTGDVTERYRQWDSCFTLSFTSVHGGPVRSTTASRYRQWFLHKLVTWHDQFGSSGCVGCGRCITWCPVGIDLTVEAAALARSAGGP